MSGLPGLRTLGYRRNVTGMTTTSATRTVTADTIGQYTLHFDSQTCSRCLGTGFMPFSVNGGRCFKCHAAKVTLTGKGRTARKAYDALRTEQMVPASDVQVGDRIKIDNVFTGTVLEITHRPSCGSFTVGGVTRPMEPTIEFRFPSATYGSHTVGVPLSSGVNRRTTALNVVLWNRALRLAGAHLADRG